MGDHRDAGDLHAGVHQRKEGNDAHAVGGASSVAASRRHDCRGDGDSGRVQDHDGHEPDGHEPDGAGHLRGADYRYSGGDPHHLRLAGDIA